MHEFINNANQISKYRGAADDFFKGKYLVIHMFDRKIEGWCYNIDSINNLILLGSYGKGETGQEVFILERAVSIFQIEEIEITNPERVENKN